MDMSGQLEFRRRHMFSNQHYYASRYFSDAAGEIEREHIGGISEEERAKHRAFVTGAIMSSVAFLESSINELFIGSKDENAAQSLSLDSSVTALLASLADIVERAPVLHKYQVALTAGGKQSLDKGGSCYQDAEGLIRLRNALIHYKPEWDDEPDAHRALETRLTGKFELNSLVDSGSLWFPHRCLGVGCAKWCVDAAANLSQEFCDRLSIPQRHWYSSAV